MVGQTIAGKLAGLNQEVMMGIRDVASTRARTDPSPYSLPPFSDWLQQNPGVKLGTFSDAAAHAEIVINATSGTGSLDALQQAGAANLNGKILIDISNPLDFSKGMPPFLAASNTDSVANGEHHIFVSGNDPEAKVQDVHFLTNWFGWKYILDLGDITTSRGTEMYMPLWLRIWSALGTRMFNIRVAK